MPAASCIEEYMALVYPGGGVARVSERVLSLVDPDGKVLIRPVLPVGCGSWAVTRAGGWVLDVPGEPDGHHGWPRQSPGRGGAL